MFGPHLFTYLIKITLGDRALAEDLLQETFLRAWRYIQAHDDVDLEAFRPWLFTVARRLMIDSLRARRARPPEVMYEDIGPASRTHNAIEDLLTAEAVREALLRLRPEQRDLLLQLTTSPSRNETE
jgi:RNA polymerase sigma-70 factor (ECF subfamily)